MTTPEASSVPSAEFPSTPLVDELIFASPGAISRLRFEQEQRLKAAGVAAIIGLPSRTDVLDHGDDAVRDARSTAAADIDDQVRQYVEASISAMDEEGRDQVRDRLVSLITSVSVNHMSDESWTEGELQADGSRSEPGLIAYNRRLLEVNAILRGDIIPEADPDPTERLPLLELRNNMGTARDKLAALSLQRRQKLIKWGRKNRDLQDKYDEAQNEYDQARLAYMTEQARQVRESITAAGGVVDENALRGDVVDLLLAEHTEFSSAEYRLMMADNSKRAKFARYLAEKGGRLFAFQAATGVASTGAGFALRWARRLLVAGTGIAAFPATLATSGVFAVGRSTFTAAIGNRVAMIRHFDTRAEKDHDALSEELHAEADTSDVVDHETFMGDANDLFNSILEGRVQKDRNNNLGRVGLAAVISAGSVVGGYYLEGLLENHHVLDSLGHGNGKSGATTPSGSSGGTAPSGGSAGTQPHNGMYEGFHTTQHIPQGAGYEQIIQNMATQHGTHLTGAQADQLWHHLESQFHGHFFTNDPSYHMSDPGGWGISHAGSGNVDPHVIDAMNEWLIANGHLTPAEAAAKAMTGSAKAAATLLHAFAGYN